MSAAKTTTLPDKMKRRTGETARHPGRSDAAGPTKPGRQPDEEPSVLLQIATLAANAFRLAAKAGGISLEVGKALLMTSPENAKMMQETGAFLKDLRELAGLTRTELSDALNLSDQSLLAAVENGTATLSFELILRLAALLARHDPVPFIIRFTRTYHPELWGMLEKWGVGKIPVHLERERQFINIYRSQDAARKLSDEGFARLLQFTQAAFEMALHFVSQQQKQEKPAPRDGKAKKPAKRQT